jgi:23S rRNA (cytosine1962-C5)-methyltransferase
MFQLDQYRLLDFGGGEKLERFGDRIVRRESPSVGSQVPREAHWDCDLQFLRTPQPKWRPETDPEMAWSISHRSKTFLLKASPSGQVGVFPEQADNWDWIENHRQHIAGMKAINLFAYTGGTTMQLADCGVDVTHVDAARPVVQWARKNAEASGLSDCSIRWIVDDAISYLQRQAGRGHKYEIVVADPPSFGRGPRNSVWKLKRDLPQMVDLICQVAPHCEMLILSSHTPQISAADLKRAANFEGLGKGGNAQTLTLKLRSETKKTLNSGQCFRWSEF